MRKSFILLRFCGICLLLLISMASFSQNETMPSRRSTTKPAAKQKTTEDYKMKAYGINLNTNAGLLGGLVFRSSKEIGMWRNKQMNRYFAIELVNIKHPKEKSYPFTSGSLIFGKMNYFLSLRPQYGREITLFKKYGEEGIGMSIIVAGGPSIGIEKPYYIKYMSNPNDSSPVSMAYDPNVQTNQALFAGPGGALEGIGYSKIIPGVNFKSAINLDVNTFGKNLTGFEIGFLAELFARRPQIMAFAENQKFYTSAYLTIYFGSKK